MRLIGTMAGLAAMSSATAVEAQSLSDAFECMLPYRDAMTAAAALEVTEQRRDDAFAILLGPGTIVEFAPGDAQIYGHAPSALSLTLREPSSTARKPIHKITFTARFPANPQIDELIIAASSWHLNVCGPGLSLCIRAKDSEPAGSGALYYYRDEGEQFRVECIYEFTEEELEALGD